jgi:hypothetical protein
MLLNTTGTSGETRTAYSSGALGWGSCCSTRLVQVVKQELLTLLEHLCRVHVAQHDWYKWWNKNCLLFWSTCVGFMLLNTTGISGETRTAYSSGALGWGSCCSTRLVQVVKEELLTLLEHLCRVHVTQSLVFWVVFGVWVLVFFVLFLLALVFSVLSIYVF